MATPNFNSNILAAARKLKDDRTDPSAAGDAGKRYKSALLTEYQNRAVRDLLKEAYVANPDAFLSLFPEYVRTSDILDVAGGVAERPADCWQVIAVTDDEETKVYFPIPQDQVSRVRAGLNPFLNPTVGRPGWYQEANSILVWPAAVGALPIIARYVASHTNIAVNGEADLLINSNWFGEIIDRMVAMGLQDNTPQQ